MEQHQETTSSRDNLFFSNSTFSGFSNPHNFESEFLTSYSPDFQYVEALLGSRSPELQFVNRTLEDSPVQQFDQPPGLHQSGLTHKDYQGFYDPFKNNQSPFLTDFPRASDYSNLATIQEAFPHLEGVNNPHFNVESSVSENAHFYIMRSSNDDNIHKAIKYHIWTTTTSGKKVLTKAWKEFIDQKKSPEVYLIFSVVNSNQFLGVAKLISDIDHHDSFKYWWEPCKWFGAFQLQWIFVKDIPHSAFEHLKQKVYQYTPNIGQHKTAILSSVTSLRDSTKINANIGKQILEIFLNKPEKPNILESFAYMDRREDHLRSQRDNDPNFVKRFEEYCNVYTKYPDNFRIPSSQPYQKKDFRKPSLNEFEGNYQHQHQHQQNTQGYSQGKYYKSQHMVPEEEAHQMHDNSQQENSAYRDNRKYSNRGGNRGRGRGYGRAGGRGPRFYANKEDYHQGYNNNNNNQSYQKTNNEYKGSTYFNHPGHEEKGEHL